MTVLSILFATFLASHVTADFLLQSDADIATKEQPVVLLKHGLIHGLLIVVFAGTWLAWLPALIVAPTHAAIDFGKQKLSGGGWRAFLADQVIHIVVLAVAAGVSVDHGIVEASLWGGMLGSTYFQMLAVAAGFVATVTAGAYFVDIAVEPFLAQIRAGRSQADEGAETTFEAIERSASSRLRGLRNGGRTIGQLERALIFLFVLVDQFSAIGFLIAAKSVFRFGELRDRSNRMEAEYIIIGTLISFFWAIVTAILTRLLAGI